MLWLSIFLNLPLFLLSNFILFSILFSQCSQTVLILTSAQNPDHLFEQAERYKFELLSSNFNKRKPLLLVTFLNISNEPSRKNIQNNMDKIGPQGDWVLIDYSHSLQNIQEACPSVFTHNTTVLCKQTSAKQGNMTVIAKPLMYVDFVSVLDNYRYVFLLDEDMSFMHFNPSNYQFLHDCAFVPSPPPLISQPLIAENTQHYEYLNYKAWKHSRLFATETPFVEQQVPYFNAVFLKWFVEYVIQPSIPVVRITESSWGTDSIWCGAAKAFAVEVLGYDPKKYVSCAIIVKGPPIHHLNLQTIKSKKTDFETFKLNGFKMIDYYTTHYSGWFDWGTDKTPLNRHHNFTRSYSLPEKCEFGCARSE